MLPALYPRFSIASRWFAVGCWLFIAVWGGFVFVFLQVMVLLHVFVPSMLPCALVVSVLN